MAVKGTEGALSGVEDLDEIGVGVFVVDECVARSCPVLDRPRLVCELPMIAGLIYEAGSSTKVTPPKKFVSLLPSWTLGFRGDRNFLVVSWSDDERRDEVFDLIESKEKRRRGVRFFCSGFCSSESWSSLGDMPDASVQR